MRMIDVRKQCMIIDAQTNEFDEYSFLVSQKSQTSWDRRSPNGQRTLCGTIQKRFSRTRNGIQRSSGISTRNL